jgi:hypothetical protein
MSTEVTVALISGGAGVLVATVGVVGKVLVDKINVMHADNRSDHGMVRDAIDGLTGKVSETNDELRDVKADVRDVKTDVRDLRSRVTDLEEHQ